MGQLDDKVAVITGSTRGFGLAVARAYVAEGAAVVVSSRSPDAVAEAIASLQAAGGRASGFPCDVGDAERVQALADHAIEHFGRFDVWVNNAGIAGPYGPTAHLPLERVSAVLRTNVFGTFHGSWVALHHFLPRGAGKLINVLGRGEKSPTPMQNAYASSKAWVRSFTKALAEEYEESGVGIYAFNPGMMTTDLLQSLEVVEGYEEKLSVMGTIVRMWAKPPEIPARKVVWLGSDATDDRTGLVVRQSRLPDLVWGALQEGLRRITGQGTPEQVEIEKIPPAI